MSRVDLVLTRAKELLETAVAALTDAIGKKEKGEPLEAGRLTAKAKKIAEHAVGIIDSTVKPRRTGDR